MPSKISERDKQKYAGDAARYRPKPPYLRNFINAFLVGGAICFLGEFAQQYFMSLGLNAGDAGARVAVVMILAGALLTGLGVYDRIGKVGGAGSAVPISGFANSIVSPAMEFSREGYILGTSAQMFVIAGPVIVYGIVSAVITAALRYWASL